MVARPVSLPVLSAITRFTETGNSREFLKLMLKLCVIVLAAGEGKRMKSATPKVLHEVAWRPMLSYVMDAAASMKPKKTVVVLSPRRPEVRGILDKSVAMCSKKILSGQPML
jgi:2-C-methyl-D-erythritol 4-phosphate cytidylyltransferase